MSKQYIYQIGGLTKKFGQREVLKDIWLAFYPGAKIGVLGRNGSGKSTLLKIMAGADRDFDGEGPAHRWLHGRLCPSRADPRRQHRRARQHRAGRRRHAAIAHQVRRDQCPLRRALGRHWHGEAARRASPRAGPDRRGECLGVRPADRDRDGRHAASGRRRRRDDALGRRAATRGVVQNAAGKARPALVG